MRVSWGRALAVTALCCLVCSVLFLLVGVKTNESGSYAVEAWLQTARAGLVPIRDYQYTGARPFLGFLYLPFFGLFGRSMEAWWWGSITLTTLAAIVFAGLAVRKWGREALILFVLAGVASPACQHYLLSGYLPPVWFAFAVALLPLYAGRMGLGVVSSVVLLAWCGTAVHDAALGIAVGVSVWGFLTVRGWRSWGAVLLCTALGVGWYFVTPVWLLGLSWHESVAANRLVAIVGRISGLLGPTTHADHGQGVALLRFGFYVVNDLLARAAVPLATVALVAGFAAAWRAAPGRLIRSFWRDPLVRLLLIVPIVSGFGYSVLSTWNSPVLLRWDTLPFALLAGGFAATGAAALPSEARRALWIAVGVIWSVGLVDARQFVLTARQVGLEPIRQVAAAVDGITQPGDTIFSGYSAIALQSRRAILPSLFRGNQSQAIYGGSTAATQRRFYDEIERHRVGAVVMVTLYWMDTSEFLVEEPDTALQRAFESFRGRFRSVCTTKHLIYGTLTIWVPAEREASAVAKLDRGPSRRCAVRA